MTDLKIEIDPKALAALENIPAMFIFKVADVAMKAAAKPVIDKAKSIAPSSRQSYGTNGPTRKKWSRKYKTNAAYQNDSGKEIGVKVLKSSRGAIAYVGAKYPLGNKQQFNDSGSGKGRRVVYWGKPQGTIYRRKERFLQRAYDETRNEQTTAFIAAAEAEVAKVNFG